MLLEFAQGIYLGVSSEDRITLPHSGRSSIGRGLRYDTAALTLLSDPASDECANILIVCALLKLFHRNET